MKPVARRILAIFIILCCFAVAFAAAAGFAFLVNKLLPEWFGLWLLKST